MSDEPEEEQTAELLQSIGDELREIKNIQQVIARNFNAVVVMIIFAVLIYLVGIFFAPAIGRNIDNWLRGTKEGQVVEGTVKEVVK